MSNKVKLAVAVAIIVVVALVAIKMVTRGGSGGKMVPIKPTRGNLSQTVATVGTVKPQNRLEIKPPITGRVEKILVREGQQVKVGEILALMSSTERATLIDAARLKGDKEFKYWQRAYKETPLIAPIDGVVIVRDVEPGQTVSAGDAVLVLSDRLIVEADVDETDIGELKEGQKAIIGLDAYPKIKIDAVVDHISHESQIVSNVTIYKVDVLPREIPDVFRSGMSANVEVFVKEVKDALLIPSDAVVHEKNGTFVRMKDSASGEMRNVPITMGLESEGQVQVVSGISEGDTIYVLERNYVVPKKKNGSTPFLPRFRRGEDKPKT
jgi:macrolide-specific efflux system membrane fusion protein